MEVRKTPTNFFVFTAVGMAVVAVMTNLGETNTAYMLGVICLVSVLYAALYKKNIRRRILNAGVAYSLLLALAIILSGQVHYVEMRSSELVNFIDIRAIHFLLAVLLAVLIFPAVVLLLDFWGTHGVKTRLKARDRISYKFFLSAWAVVFFCWLPYLLTFYPGGVVGDGACAIEEALLPGFPQHSHWGVLHILLLKFYIWLGSQFTADINAAIFLYVTAQSICLSGIFAFMAAKVQQKGFPNVVAWMVVFVYAISGFFASYGMSLWKDGLFGGAVVLLALHLWDCPEEGKISPSYAATFVLLGFFLCFWRNNGLYLFTFILLGCLFFLKVEKRTVLVSLGLLVIIISLIIQGPVYDSLQVGKDTLSESLSVPLQQIAAVINEGTELTPYQEEILFSMLPEEEWLSNYCPTLSDDIKAPVGLNIAHWDMSHLLSFLHVWLQLLLPNLKTYVEAYFMQMLGYWQLGTQMANYYDYWIGVQDLFNRNIIAQDLIKYTFQFSIYDLLTANMKFLSSGTMVWIMLFSIAAVWGQGHKRDRRLLVLLPMLGSWLVILLAAPIAYAYRYIIMLPMALPLFILLPLYHSGTEEAVDDGRGVKISDIWQKRILIGVSALALISTGLGYAEDIKHVKEYCEEPFTIHCSGDQYNAADYVRKGLSESEGNFTWTDGKLLSVTVPSEMRTGDVKVTISVDGTFNGEQAYQILKDGSVLTEGVLSGTGIIEFTLKYDKSDISFDMAMPDAQIVSEVVADSGDSRELAFRLIKIQIVEE